MTKMDFKCRLMQGHRARYYTLAVSQFRVYLLGSTLFEVVEVIALLKVCLISLNTEAYSK